MFDWLNGKPAEAFGQELAKFVMEEIPGAERVREGKFAAKALKTLERADRRVADFKKQHPLNVYKRAKLANGFLWGLKDAGCPQAYADQLTEWLSFRL